MQRICVFCGSNFGARQSYTEAAKNLARYLAANKVAIVFGGSRLGLMGILADTAMEAGGDVIGIIPRNLVEKEASHRGLRDLRVVNSMHERKAMMAELSDAFIAMPGGYGTFEEFCEVVTWAQLGLHRKPCGLLNVEGYFDHLLALFDHAVTEKFLKPENRRMVIADDRPESLVAQLSEYQVPLVAKWIEQSET